MMILWCDLWPRVSQSNLGSGMLATPVSKIISRAENIISHLSPLRPPESDWGLATGTQTNIHLGLRTPGMSLMWCSGGRGGEGWSSNCPIELSFCGILHYFHGLKVIMKKVSWKKVVLLRQKIKFVGSTLADGRSDRLRVLTFHLCSAIDH